MALRQNLLSLERDFRVCSIHFVDSKPSDINPNPTLKLGMILREERNVSVMALYQQQQAKTNVDVADQ